MSYKVFIDCEAYADQLCEFAYIKTDENLKILEKESIKIRPSNLAKMNTFSLPYTTLEVFNFPKLEENFEKIKEILYCGEVYGFAFESDLRLLYNASHALFNDNKFTYNEIRHDFKDCVGGGLESLCRAYHINFKQSHSALSDAKATLKLFKVSRKAKIKTWMLQKDKPKHPVYISPVKNNDKNGRIASILRVIQSITPSTLGFILNTSLFANEDDFQYIQKFISKIVSFNIGIILFNKDSIYEKLSSFKREFPNVIVINTIEELKKIKEIRINI